MVGGGGFHPLPRQQAGIPGRQIFARLAVKFSAFKLPHGYTQLALAMGACVWQQKAWAVAQGRSVVHLHPAVDVGVQQRLQVKQATQGEGRGGRCAGGQVILFLPALGQQHADQVTACGAAADADIASITTVDGDVAHHPGKHLAHLIDDVVQRHRRGQIVLRHDHHGPSLRERRGHEGRIVLAQGPPVATVDKYKNRSALRLLLRALG